MKKILLSFLTSLIIFSSIVPNFLIAKAAGEDPGNETGSTQKTPTEGTWYNQGFDQWYNKVYNEDTSPSNEIFGERYAAAQVEWILYSLFAFVLNKTTDPKTTECLMNNDLTDCVDRLKDLFKVSSLNNSTNLSNNDHAFISFFSKNRPLSGVTYVKTLVGKYSIVGEVNAQTSGGFGFGALDPILPLWRASRNISFGLIIIAVLILSFMIMFRVKISPQVVISAQSAIPKVIVGLILITFSYAIAGFMVDLMYVVIGLISLLVSQASGTFSASDYFLALTQGPAATGIFGWLAGYLILFVISLFGSLFFSNGVIAFIASVVTLWAGVLSTLGILATVIMIIILLFNVFKILWMLFKTFANILISVIFAPFQILLGIVTPAGGFGTWLKGFAAHLAVFPVTGVLLILSYTFCVQAFAFVLSSFGTLPSGSNPLELVTNIFGDFLKGTIVGVILAPALNGGWPPLLGIGKASAGLVFVGASVVTMSLIPKVVEIIQGFITGKPFAYGTAIGEAVGPLAGIGGFAGGIAKDVGRSYLTQRFFGQWPSRTEPRLDPLIESRLNQQTRPGSAPRSQP